MAKIIALTEIAAIVEQELNDIAVELYNDDELSNKIVFKITADFQDYQRSLTKEFEVDDEVVYTPGVLERINFEQFPDSEIGMYSEEYSINIYSFFKDNADIRKIFDTYVYRENTTNRLITEGDWLIQKTTRAIDLSGEIEPQDGTGEEREVGVFTFAWSFLDGGVHSSKVVVKIDNVRIPINAFSLSKEKINFPATNLSYGELSALILNGGFTLTLNMPYTTSNAKVKEILDDIIKNTSLFKTYSINISDGNVNETLTTHLISGQETFTNNSTVNIEATFAKSSGHAVSIAIDTIPIIYTTYSFSKDKQLISTVQTGENFVKNIPQSGSLGINIKFPYDKANTKHQAILRDILEPQFLVNTYTLTRTDGTVSVSYTVRVASGNETSENGLDMIEANFVIADTRFL
jgi:hypothetical protein